MMRNLMIFSPQTSFNYKRVAIKTLFLIGLGHLFLDNVYFVLFQGAPEFVQRNCVKHPINPPFVIPHQMGEPEEYEKWQLHWRKIFNIAQWSRQKLDLQKNTHSKLETDYLLTEAFWVQESERVIEEAKNELKQRMRKLKIKELENENHMIQKRSILNSLDANIRPK